ncbi:MAG: hypothetical protein H6912_07775 [Kordiimonadaceae bacterium]|nr:hypothetical protein [Kordiimonadaceae bacterium]
MGNFENNPLKEIKVRHFGLILSVVAFTASFSVYGQEEKSDPGLTNEEYQLKREIEQVRERINQYDKYQQTFIPDSWRMPVMKKMISMADWSLSEQDQQAEWCDEFMRDVKSWTNMEVVEPYIMQNNFGHVVFDDYHKLPDNQGFQKMPHFIGKFGGYLTFCSRSFRVYDMNEDGDGERQDLFICFDGKRLEDIGLLQDKQHEPFGLNSNYYIGGIVKFTSPNRYENGLLKRNELGAGGGFLNRLFALSLGAPKRSTDQRFNYSRENDVFVVRYGERKIAVTLGVVLKENNNSNDDKTGLKQEGIFLNLYKYPKQVPMCVLNAPLNKIETIMGEMSNG